MPQHSLIAPRNPPRLQEKHAPFEAAIFFRENMIHARCIPVDTPGLEGETSDIDDEVGSFLLG